MSHQAEMKRPPDDRGQGRKSLKGDGKSPVLQIRVTPELKAAVTEKGMGWAREALTKAIEAQIDK